jgi:hypothetical protein
MPSQQNHLATAIENRRIALHLLDSEPKSLAWATTICFYSALHLVEAAMASSIQHFDGHDVRNSHLKSTKNLQHNWRHYKQLFDHSLKARYLMTDVGSAESLIADSLGEEGVRKQLIGHYLRQVEKSVAKILGMDSIFE